MESFYNTLSGDSLILLKNNECIKLKDASKLHIIDIMAFDINTLTLVSTKGKVIKTNVTTFNHSTFSNTHEILCGKYTLFLTNVNNTLIYYELDNFPILKLKIKDETIEKFSYSFPTTHPDEFVQSGYTVKLLSGSNFLSPGTSPSNEYFVIKLP